MTKSIIEHIEETTYCYKGCWESTSYESGEYPIVKRRPKIIYLHRFMYEYFFGIIPASYDVDHLCRNKRCINPLYLEPVTRSENILRGDRRTKLMFCSNYHQFTKENTYMYKSHRVCRACHRQYAKSRRAFEKSLI